MKAPKDPESWARKRKKELEAQGLDWNAASDMVHEELAAMDEEEKDWPSEEEETSWTRFLKMIAQDGI